MRQQHYKIFDFVKCLIFWTFLIQTPKKAVGFWPFTDTTPTTPTLKFYPEPPDAYQNTLIYYKHSDIESSRKHIDSLKTFLSTYEATHATNVYDCKFESPPPPNSVCDVNTRKLDVCSGHDFGFNRGGPCILLIMTKVENWIPTTFNESEVELLAKMPSNLKKYISEQPEKGYIWVSCEGESPADVELMGPIEYYPNRGFPAYYFPFTNQEAYLSPIVAVRFIRPTHGVVISIGCKLWARNIQVDRENQIGYTNFHLLID